MRGGSNGTGGVAICIASKEWAPHRRVRIPVLADAVGFAMWDW